MREITYIEAIKEAIIEEMKADEKVYVVGQDVRGSIFPHTEGLVDLFGEDRIVDTPISEVGMYGTALGSSLHGYRPIVDFMFGAFAYNCFAECSVATGQQYFLHGSQTPVPLVMTAGVGTGQRLANDHSMMIHGTFLHHPGIKVAMASTPFDAKGLFKAAIRDNNPVMIPWHMGLMMDKGDVPEEDYVVPLGKADVKREGTDVTVLANGLMYKHAMAVAEKLGGDISVEVVDPRTFDPFDMETLLASVEKTARLVIVDEDWEAGGFAATISARMMEEGFDLLDAPVLRVVIPNMPIPGGYMEPAIVPGPEKIEAAIRKVCA